MSEAAPNGRSVDESDFARPHLPLFEYAGNSCRTAARLSPTSPMQLYAGLVRQLRGQVGREDSSHDISRYTKETISGTPQSRAFIFVASLLGGLLQQLDQARQGVVGVWVQTCDEVGLATHFREANRSHACCERNKAASFKRSGCPLDFVRFKVSGFSDDVLVNVKVASVDPSRDFAQHWVIASDPHLVETFHHGVIVAGCRRGRADSIAFGRVWQSNMLPGSSR